MKTRAVDETNFFSGLTGNSSQNRIRRMKQPFSKHDYCQLYRLLDRYPSDIGLGPRQAMSDAWEVVRGKLMALDLDPDEVVNDNEVASWDGFDYAAESFSQPVG